MKQLILWSACLFVAGGITAFANAAHEIDLTKYDRPGEPTWAQLLAAPHGEAQRRFPHLQGRQ